MITVGAQIRSFQNVYMVLDKTIIYPDVTCHGDYCNWDHVPFGFPNHINVEYVLVKDFLKKATMTLQIQSNTSGLSFNRIEIVSIDANPRRCGMGTLLFEQAKAVATALEINEIWGTILDDDASVFYKAIGCEVKANKFRYYIDSGFHKSSTNEGGH